ncbi:dihydroxyacetone kinase phosphoryl donor subunit DhaM [Actinocatenispora rupis]|uniref:phosphoenolpyruvate--glycerone phosphotransferase n=1 Tax=Actinocatenispora rupis TaxID=519421 RepID=A0A8J3JCV7_9ACTN|nr:dihydroxyacetone kinase phosphoryl donor subunit DhaM [Actinocatenispora rupis]GID12498.1 multiphosphoryl transfer protein (MTP) [Actinocatenispora rupis]
MIGLVLVSHSAALAAGLRDLVGQMAPGVPVVAAGGDADGGLGTSPDLVADAVTAADSGAGVAILYDLGSARMSAELALEFLDPDVAGRARVVDAAFVEGALEAGVAAAAGGDLSAVATAAAEAGPERAEPEPAAPVAADLSERVVLTDPAGLHFRPAAAVVRALTGLSAVVQVAVPGRRSASAGSLSGLLRLSAPVGAEVVVSASGPDASAAVARVVDVLSSATDTPAPAEAPRASGTTVGAAPGRRVGPLSRPGLVAVAVPAEEYQGAERERERLDAALRRVRDELAGGGIVAAHRALLADPELTDAAFGAVADGTPAAAAWWAAVERTRAALAAVPDAVIASRAVDVADVGRRVLGALTGHPVVPSVPAGAVLLADDLPPSLVPELAARGAVGFVLRAGGARSHAAVLARAAGVPMVVAAGDVLDAVPDGTPVLVDGGTGELVVDPDERDVPPAAAPVVTGPVRRADGGELRLAANVGSVADARSAAANGAGGVGLLRTELLFAGRTVLPDEDEQVAWLTGILAACPPGPVVVRTVDLGGDKPVPALGLDPVRHGFLGDRGLRLCLSRPDLFRTHLRAVLRAAAVRPVEVMVPFVTEPAELAAARDALRAAAESLRGDGVPYAEPAAVGMMVEIPTAALSVAPFLPLVDFLSVGSNDLAQYLSASDRTLPEVAGTYRAGERLVPDLVRRLVAEAGSVPVAVCGDLAGDPEYARRLVAAGVAELSMAAPLLPALRAALA